MRNNRIKMKKIFSACLIATGTLFVSTSANATVGWPVVNVMDNFYYNAFFGSMGQFTRAMGQQHDAIRGAIDASRMSTEVMIRQNDILQRDTDARMRMALGQADIAKRDFEQMPTLNQCAELTAGRVSSAVIKASESSSVTGGGGGNSSKAAKAQNSISRSVIKNKEDELVRGLTSNAQSGTCNPSLEGIGGCPGNLADTPTGDKAIEAWNKARNSGEVTTEFLGSDIYPYGILGNSSNIEKVNKLGDYANYSMSQKQYEEVAMKYINDATSLNGPPTIISKESKAKNPGFFTKYAAYQTKINAAKDALSDIARQRIAAPETAFPAESVAGDVLKKFQDKYALYFPHLKKPETPSMFELMKFNVVQDYFFDEKVTGDANAMMEMELKRQALQNLMLLRTYEQQERTNILLSHILVQLTNPVSVKALSDEAAASNLNIK